MILSIFFFKLKRNGFCLMTSFTPKASKTNVKSYSANPRLSQIHFLNFSPKLYKVHFSITDWNDSHLRHWIHFLWSIHSVSPAFLYILLFLPFLESTDKDHKKLLFHYPSEWYLFLLHNLTLLTWKFDLIISIK